MSDLVAVTGATGFIGSRVVRKLLDRGARVRAILEPGANTKNIDGLSIETATADVCDAKAMGAALDGARQLYHLAAIYRTWLADRSLMYRVNVEGTTTTLLAAKQAGIRRIVYTSSIAAIGLVPGGVANEETVFDLFDIANDYILSKWLSERVAMNFATAGMPIVVVNPGFPFGPGDIAPTPTGKIVCNVLTGKLPGGMPGGISAIDVDDCAEGHLLAAERGRVGERYVLANHNITIRELIDRVARLAEKRVVSVPIPKPLGAAVAWGMEKWADHVSRREPPATYLAARYAMRNAFFSNEKAVRELGLPSRPLDETLERSIGWFREQQMI